MPNKSPPNARKSPTPGTSGSQKAPLTAVGKAITMQNLASLPLPPIVAPPSSLSRAGENRGRGNTRQRVQVAVGTFTDTEIPAYDKLKHKVPKELDPFYNNAAGGATTEKVDASTLAPDTTPTDYRFLEDFDSENSGESTPLPLDQGEYSERDDVSSFELADKLSMSDHPDPVRNKRGKKESSGKYKGDACHCNNLMKTMTQMSKDMKLIQEALVRIEAKTLSSPAPIVQTYAPPVSGRSAFGPFKRYDFEV